MHADLITTMERTQILANDFVNQQDPKAQKFVVVL